MNNTNHGTDMLELSQIRIDGGTQSRVELNQETVAEYAHAFTEGASFPPVVVFFDGADYWLADGFHRYFGARDAGESAVYAEIKTGTRRDAVLYSWGANDKHGLPRSNADKRHIVTAILKDETASKWSDRDIAKRFGFSHPFVGNVRRSLETVSSEVPAERTYTTKHGTTAVMDTTNIGKAPMPTLSPEQLEKSVARIAADNNAVRRAQIADLAAEMTDAPDDEGPDEAELRASELQEQADQEAFNKLLLADDKLATAYDEIKRLNAVNAVLESRMQGLMNEKAEAIRLVKSRDRQTAKLEAMLKEAA